MTSNPPCFCGHSNVESTISRYISRAQWSEPEASERSSSLIGAVSSQKVIFQRRFGFWSCAFRMRSCSQIFLSTITCAMAYNVYYATDAIVYICTYYDSANRTQNIYCRHCSELLLPRCSQRYKTFINPSCLRPFRYLYFNLASVSDASRPRHDQ